MCKRIEIYQIKKDAPNARLLLFGGIEYLEEYGFEVKLDNYNKVYECSLDVDSLDDIYSKFQGLKPVGFTGHSISVSDIIKVDDEYWYVDDFGYKKLEF